MIRAPATRAGGRRPRWLPDPGQELLLQAALDDDRPARAAWERWLGQVGFEPAGGAEVQVMPLVWRNLTRHGGEAPGLERLRGVYRHTWVKNQLTMRFGARVLTSLEAAGIPTLVLKGVALCLLDYGDPGVRTMADLDVLVPRERARDAIAVLRRTLEPDPSFPPPERRVSVHHSAPFGDGGEHELDLHWYSLWRSAPDDDFWRAAVPLEVAGARTLALCPPDRLLQLTAHGAAWNPQGILRWVADAVTVIRRNPELDWDRFCERARAAELTAGMAEALGYLRSSFGADVPDGVIEALRASRLTPSARLAQRARTRPLTAPRVLAMHWERYRRLRRLDPAAPRERSFGGQLRTWWGYETGAGFGRHALRRALGARRS